MPIPTLPHLQKELFDIMDNDAALREELMNDCDSPEEYLSRVEVLTTENGKWLHKVLEQYGWPGIKEVELEGADAAWYIAQNAIALPNTMRFALELLRKAYEANNAQGWHLAFLEDAILFFERKPQIYGTQFDWDRAGNMIPWAIADEAHVDARRRAIGLNTLEERKREILLELIDADEQAPLHFNERKNQFEQWRKEVGWVL
jgi:hypothetical protein